MAEAKRKEIRRSDRLKKGDGRVSLPQSARIAGVPESTLNGWIITGLIEPSIAGSVHPGPGNHRRFDVRDLTAICVVAELRNRGVHLRALRRIQKELRTHDKDFASARLALVENGENAVVDVVLLRSESERKKLVVSVFDTPGQSIIAELERAPVARRVRSAFRSALKEKPAIRGRRPGRAEPQTIGATG